VTVVLGRDSGVDAGPTGALGSYRAVDGSRGADVALDLDKPHAGLVVGKRGYGKSYTLGVLAEELAHTPGLAPVVVDTMGVFGSLAGDDRVQGTVDHSPTVAPDSLPPRSWCDLLGLSPESGAGTLVWRAAQDAHCLDGMRTAVESADAPAAHRRAAANHLDLAASWGVFHRAGLDAGDLDGGEATVLDLSGLDDAPMNAVVRGVAASLYSARIQGSIARLPWLLVDEVHAFFDGVAAPVLRRLLTRGRTPGVSLVAATQRPSAVPDVAVSQSDLLVAHRLTSAADLDALAAAQPTYMRDPLSEQLPTEPGGAVVVDDATETVHAVRVRERQTPHEGASPRASEVETE